MNVGMKLTKLREFLTIYRTTAGKMRVKSCALLLERIFKLFHLQKRLSWFSATNFPVVQCALILS